MRGGLLNVPFHAGLEGELISGGQVAELSSTGTPSVYGNGRSLTQPPLGTKESGVSTQQLH